MSLDPEGIRFYFKGSYRAVLFVATAVLFTSSVGLNDNGKLVVELPWPLFLSAVTGASALAMFSVPYVTVSDGVMRIYNIFSKKYVPLEKVVRFVLEEGGSVRVQMLDGSAHHVRLYHIAAKERERLVEMLARIAPMADERKEGPK